jgi:hypothetical protein
MRHILALGMAFAMLAILIFGGLFLILLGLDVIEVAESSKDPQEDKNGALTLGVFFMFLGMLFGLIVILVHLSFSEKRRTYSAQ